MKNYFLMFCAGAMLLCSCAKEDSENVNQDSIYTIYELFYNDVTDITVARSTFRFGGVGGTLLELTDPATSSFEGDVLNYNNLGFHSKEYVGRIDEGTFSYTDLDNNTFTNSIGTINEIGYPAESATISVGGAYEFQWTGDPVGENEVIYLTLNGPAQANLQIFTIAQEGATSMVLEADRLQTLGIGDATYTLQRLRSDLTVDEGTSTGGRTAVWYITNGSFVLEQ